MTTTFGIQVASHSDKRYQAFATRFHFLRWRSSPSTFSATGIPTTRGIQVKTALAALQYSTASWRVVEQMKRGKERMRDRVEIFVADGRQVFQIHAAIGRLGIRSRQ